MMRWRIGIPLSFLIGVIVLTPLRAGDTVPPEPPAPTMLTLEELHTGLEAMEAGWVGVQRTGQTTCWSDYGSPRDCAGSGQDGEHQVGVWLDPRFTDNGDGTVTDNLTKLVWLKDAGCLGSMVWADALAETNSLADGQCGLTDGSVAGDWRMPNIRELYSVVYFDTVEPALPPGHPFAGVQQDYYWSSTTRVTTASWYYVLAVNLHLGHRWGGPRKTDPYCVWAVRDSL